MDTHAWRGRFAQIELAVLDTAYAQHVFIAAAGRGAHGDKQVLWQLLNEEDPNWHLSVKRRHEVDVQSREYNWLSLASVPDKEKASLVQDMTGCTPGHWLGPQLAC